MEHTKAVTEFEARIDRNGVLTVPKEVLERLTVQEGSKVRVRITSEKISAALRKRTVTEDEIDRISRMQMEPRENVVKFLLSEGSLTPDRGFIHKAKKALG